MSDYIPLEPYRKHQSGKNLAGVGQSNPKRFKAFSDKIGQTTIAEAFIVSMVLAVIGRIEWIVTLEKARYLRHCRVLIQTNVVRGRIKLMSFGDGLPND